MSDDHMDEVYGVLAQGIISMERRQRQAVVMKWAIDAFGNFNATNPQQRAVRFMEEAIELYQAVGAPKEMLHKLVDFVFERHVGKLKQEFGGVSLTLLALAESLLMDADAEEIVEITRCLVLGPEHFTKRNEEKDAAGFRIHLGDPGKPG